MAHDSGEGESGVRRLSDKFERWLGVILLGAVSVAVSLLVYTFKGMPDQMRALEQQALRTQYVVDRLTEKVVDLEQANKVSQDWRTRQLQLESKVERLGDRQNEIAVQVRELRDQRRSGRP